MDKKNGSKKRIRDYDKQVAVFMPQIVYDFYKSKAKSTKHTMNDLMLMALSDFALNKLADSPESGRNDSNSTNSTTI